MSFHSSFYIATPWVVVVGFLCFCYYCLAVLFLSLFFGFLLLNIYLFSSLFFTLCLSILLLLHSSWLPSISLLLSHSRFCPCTRSYLGIMCVKRTKKNTQTFLSLSLVSFVFAFISCLLRVVFRLSCSDSYIRFSFAGNVEVDRVVAAGVTGLLLNFEYNRSDFYQRLNKSCVPKFDKWKHRLAVLTFNRCRTLPFFMVRCFSAVFNAAKYK